MTTDQADSRSSCMLSATVLVYNGIETIARCLDSLSFCDEIVVIDDMSTDGTWEYLRQRPGITVLQHAHTTFAAQRAMARDRCRGRWVLTMDADEYVTAKLASSIRRTIAETKYDGLYIKRKNPYPSGLKGHHWSWHPRLVRTERCRWVDTDSHHSPLDKAGLKLGRIRKAWLDHAPPGDVATSLRKSINRGTILAKQMRARGKRAGAWRMTISSIGRFLNMYFRHGGWRHGNDGFLFSILFAMDAFCKYAMLIARPADEQADAPDGGPGSFSPSAHLVDPDLDRMDNPKK